MNPRETAAVRAAARILAEAGVTADIRFDDGQTVGGAVVARTGLDHDACRANGSAWYFFRLGDEPAESVEFRR